MTNVGNVKGVTSSDRQKYLANTQICSFQLTFSC